MQRCGLLANVSLTTCLYMYIVTLHVLDFKIFFNVFASMLLFVSKVTTATTTKSV